MNYIILSDRAEKQIEESYNELREKFNYPYVLSSYKEELLFFDGELQIRNRAENGGNFSILGKNCSLTVKRDNRHPDSFYALSFSFYNDKSQYLKHFAQTITVHGEWEIISYKDARDIDDDEADDIEDILSVIKKSKKEYYEFEDKWKLWDTYNSKLKEITRKKNESTKCKVINVILENNVFMLTLDKLDEAYVKGEIVSIILSSLEKPKRLGEIISVSSKENTIEVESKDWDFIETIRTKKQGEITGTILIDYGTESRLKRQEYALKRLFDNETANPTLKEILMGEFDYKRIDLSKVSKEISSLFDFNSIQEEAFNGAVCADDIFLIQGPPGTGKTTIITGLVKHFTSKGERVLVSSETNIAVDNVLERIRYNENVVALRLGNEERVGEGSLPYLPDRIAKSIVNEAKRKLDEFDYGDYDIKRYIESIKKEYDDKAIKLKNEMSDIRCTLPQAISPNELWEKITDYENLVLELNERYIELNESRQKNKELEAKKSEILSKLHTLQARADLAHSSVAETSFIDIEREVRTTELEKEIMRLNSLVKDLEGKISLLDYSGKSGRYERRWKRAEKNKAVLMDYFNKKGSFNTIIHQAKEALTNFTSLCQQAESIEKRRDDNISKAKSTFLHKESLLKKSREIRKEWKEILSGRGIYEVIEKNYLNQTNVIFATCTGIASADNGDFATMDYDCVIIDEAAKCNTLDLLIPLVMGKKIILVGDHKQLYPMLETKNLEEELTREELDKLKDHTLFKDLFENKVPKEYRIMLNHQYRMPFEISEFVSDRFYDGNLESEKEKNIKTSLVWIEVNESEEESSGSSFINKKEAEIIVNLVKKLDLRAKNKTELGIICIYKAQALYIKNMLSTVTLSNLSWECSSVDAFQGKEKDIIIFDIVRTNVCNDFMADENRTNVAMSRTKEELFVVGNIKIQLQPKAALFKELYKYIEKNGRVYNENYVKE